MDQQIAAWMPTLIIMLTVIIGSIYNNYRISHLDTRIGDLKELTRAEIGRVEGTLRTEIGRVEGTVRGDIAALRADIAKLDQRVERLENQRIVRS